MRVLIPFLVEDAGLVEVVDADLTRGVDDALAIKHDTHVNDFAFLIAEKGQVAGLDLGQEIHQLTLMDLLRSIAGKHFACCSGAELDETTAIDAENRPTTPKIGSVQHLLGKIQHQGRGEAFRDGHGSCYGFI